MPYFLCLFIENCAESIFLPFLIIFSRAYIASYKLPSPWSIVANCGRKAIPNNSSEASGGDSLAPFYTALTSCVCVLRLSPFNIPVFFLYWGCLCIYGCALVIYKCRCGDKTRVAACTHGGEKLATKRAEIEPEEYENSRRRRARMIWPGRTKRKFPPAASGVSLLGARVIRIGWSNRIATTENSGVCMGMPTEREEKNWAQCTQSDLSLCVIVSTLGKFFSDTSNNLNATAWKNKNLNYIMTSE